jgi:hypothetical protein
MSPDVAPRLPQPPTRTPPRPRENDQT